MLKVTSGAPMADGCDCGKTPQNSASQTISIGGIITAKPSIWGSLLRHPNTLCFCPAIARPAKIGDYPEGRQAAAIRMLAIINAGIALPSESEIRGGYHLTIFMKSDKSLALITSIGETR
jgi:hypothetical protein